MYFVLPQQKPTDQLQKRSLKFPLICNFFLFLWTPPGFYFCMFVGLFSAPFFSWSLCQNVNLLTFLMSNEPGPTIESPKNAEILPV